MTDQQLPPAAPAPQPEIPAQWGGVTQVEAEGPATWVQPPPPKPSLKDRHVLRAVARWTLAVLVFGGAGAGTAYGITSMERTDVPGLATQADGRWDYPALKLPALPEGKPRPFGEANPGEIHHAALTDLMLDAPKGAKDDTGPKAVTGKEFAGLYAKDSRGEVANGLRDYGIREIVSRSWTAPDGTQSRIYLVRFPSVGYADGFLDEILSPAGDAGREIEGVGATVVDEKWENPREDIETQLYMYDSAPEDKGDDRVAYLASGDTIGVIVQTRKGGAERVPFHQTVVLQTQLLD
ncbi:hypothetical protein [Streptomyces indicus]|uniref:Uncharacterized protein n=1 Tax=Streptomyces indicus TaxID=417292 RepID=A0A1G9HCC0_9ACTN|nr:hypothetical protein [Streptomyces indicus]SDL10143.1 hypothetical protein SAMN05421806_11895 [Streptomyces indicus]